MPLPVPHQNLRWPEAEIQRFCQRWHVHQLALFGSALGKDFQPDSDVDLLVDFEESARPSLLDHIRMEQELEALLGRPVDLVSRQAVEESTNWIRRREILDSAKTIDVG
jgi:hypothetical protein